MRTTLRLAVALVAALPLAGCGGDDDLRTPVAEDVRGARIDAAPEAREPREVAVVETAPEPADEPPAPAAAPDTQPPAEPAAAEDAPEPPSEIPLGDVPTADDEIAPPPVEEPEPAAGSEAGTEEAAAADDWEPMTPKPPVFMDGEWNTSFEYLGSFDVGFYALDAASPLAQHTPKMPLPEKEAGAPEPEKGIPEAVRKMHGQKVRIEGYMIPLKFEDGKVKTFFLSRYMMGCCFGVLPRANELIEVTMVEGKGAYYDAYMPFVVVGTFEVVEDGTDPEFLQSVFRMKGDSADYAEDF